MMTRLSFFVLVPFLLCGCSFIAESGKKLWGSSTMALETARKDAVGKTFRCTMDECFDGVYKLTQPDLAAAEGTPERAPKLGFFLKDRVKQHIVVMGVPGCVNTTEVGIFLEPAGDGQTKVELSSLSTKAKLAASEIVFQGLEKSFPVVP